MSTHYILVLLSVYFTEDGQGLGKALVEASKVFEVSAPRIDKSNDSAKEKAIKNIISQMLQFEPANRINAAQVVDRLLELTGDKTEVKKPSAAKEEFEFSKKEVEKPSAAQEEHNFSKREVEKPSAAQEELKGNKPEGQKPKSRMPKWWPSSKN